jgi:hypothetical protein
MDVMRLGTAVSDELIAHEERKRQVREPAAVQVAELAMAVPELRAAKPMSSCRHARP